MAHPEQLERLRRSIADWNEWRLDHPEVRPDLSFANLSGVSLPGVSLFSADLRGINFRAANLSEADLDGADLSSDELLRADIDKATSIRIISRGANFYEVDLSSARPFTDEISLSETDPRGAHLSGVDLSEVDFSKVDFSSAKLLKADIRSFGAGKNDSIRANLKKANLSRANLNGANLSGAILSEAILTGTGLIGADLSGADLGEANLSFAYLKWTTLSGADLSRANLSGTHLDRTHFSRTNLSFADLSEARFDGTTFARIDLTNVKGLETAIHRGPSAVDINSVTLPTDEDTRLRFLRGVGFTETQIEYLPSLLTPRPIEYASLFISYAHQDEGIAKRLYTDLRKKDVPCWFAPHDLRPGIPIVRGIEEAIHLHEKLLLILSLHAMNSPWVQQEVEAALYKEVTTAQEMLFPIRLDNAVLSSDTLWARRLRQRHIGDFTNWQDDAAYQQAFITLLRHLKVNKPPTA